MNQHLRKQLEYSIKRAAIITGILSMPFVFICVIAGVVKGDSLNPKILISFIMANLAMIFLIFGFVLLVILLKSRRVVEAQAWGKEWPPNEISAEEFFGEELGEILASISSTDRRISRRELKRVLRRILQFLYNHPEKWARPGKLPLEVDFGKERGLRLSLFPEEAEGLAEEEEADELLVIVDLEGKGWWIKLFPVNEILSLRKSKLMRNASQQKVEEERRANKE